MLFDGVELSTRTADLGYGGLMRRVQAISSLYDAPASVLVSSIYLDDKVEASYTVDLNEDIPPDLRRPFAENLCQLFRELGGYNGLIVGVRGEDLLIDDPWWPDESLLPANDP